MSRRVGRRLSLRTRLLAGLLLIAAPVLVAFDLATVTALRHFLTHRADVVMDSIERGATNYPVLSAELAGRAERGRLRSGIVDLIPTDYYVAIVTADRATVAVVADTDVRPRLPGDLVAVARSGHDREVAGTDGTSRFLLRATPMADETLVVAANLRSVSAAVNQLEAILAVGTAVTLGVLAVAGAVAVRRSLRPLESMATQADRITAGDLTHRVAPHTPDTEVGRLGVALNRMLARIESAVRDQEAGQERMRRFFADASHELRTPLTSLRANAELYEQGALPEQAQVDEAMRRIRVSAQRMSMLVDDMLHLARLGDRPERPVEKVDLSALLADSVRDAQAADGDHAWTARIRPGLLVHGDPDLLRRAVDNLLGNVRTHTPAATACTLTAQPSGNQIVIEVADTGPGIPEHAFSRLFDRFYRVEGPHTGPGSGLGLAIVADVAAAHGGTATACTNTPHGLRIQLVLPEASGRGQLTLSGAS
jgi:two-component system OmpR family sensor kinase